MKLVVVGSGLAGLLTAIEASEGVPGAEVTLVTKGSLLESNTAWAQGGVAIVGPQPDTVVSHVTDTRRAGAGRCSGWASAWRACWQPPSACRAWCMAGRRARRSAPRG